MSKISDQEYLRKDQYKDARNLNARIRIHQEFSTNPYGWFRWVFDQYDLPPQVRILELGCGPGDLWLDNIHRIPAGWEITLSDFSPGMWGQAREKLSLSARLFNFETIDAQSIPYDADHFNAVIANHFLYHVPDRVRALAEIRRVLKPGGTLYATTVGEDHLRELPSLMTRFDPEIEDYLANKDFPFTLENGAPQLREFFSEVSMQRYLDELRVTDAEILADYMLSSMRVDISITRRPELIRFLEQAMAANNGVIVIHKDSGMFLAR